MADARKVLASMASDPVEPGEEGVWLPPDVLANFSAYLDTWESTAGEDEVFRWDGEIAADQAEYLMHAFFRLAHHLNETVQER